MIYLPHVPSVTSFLICFFQDFERMLSRFIFSRLRSMACCGQTWVQAPQSMQNRWSIWDLPSTRLTALHGQMSIHAWHDSPLQISLFVVMDPSNGFVMVAASTGHISWHHPQFTQLSSFRKTSPLITASSGFILYSPYEQDSQTALIACVGHARLQTRQ